MFKENALLYVTTQQLLFMLSIKKVRGQQRTDKINELLADLKQQHSVFLVVAEISAMLLKQHQHQSHTLRVSL